MSLTTIVKELWRFVKDNLLRIMIGAVLVAVVTIGARYYITEIVFKDKADAVEYLETVYSQTPASFKAVVTIEDGQILSNPQVFDDYFSSPDVVKILEERTGVSITPALESEQTLELYKSPTFRGGIAGVKDNASGTFIFRVLVARTAEENLAVAKAMSEMLVSDSIPFMTNQQAAITVEAVSAELLDTETYLNIPTLDTLSIYHSNNARSLVIYGVLGLIAGTLLTIALIFFVRLAKPKVQYAFEYAWDLDDTHVLLDHSTIATGLTLERAINLPLLENRWVVSQSSLSTDGFNLGAGNVSYLSTLSSDQPLNGQPSEIVLVVQANHTDKNWLKAQLTVAKLYKAPIKLVHTI